MPPRFPFRWQCGQGRSIFEIPPTTVRVMNCNLPAGGGGHLRILPMAYTRWALRRTRQQDGEPITVYFHPWEIDPGQPRLAGKWKSMFRHYFNLSRMEGRLGELLTQGRFVPLRDYLRSRMDRGPVPLRPLPPDSAPPDAR